MPGAGRPHEVSLSGDMLIVAKSGKKAGFAQPVALHQSDAGQNLAGAADKLRGHRRPAVGDLLEARQIVFFELRELRQQVDHRRHQNGVADTRAVDGLAKVLRGELRDRDLAARRTPAPRTSPGSRAM